MNSDVFEFSMLDTKTGEKVPMKGDNAFEFVIHVPRTDLNANEIECAFLDEVNYQINKWKVETISVNDASPDPGFLVTCKSYHMT